MTTKKKYIAVIRWFTRVLGGMTALFILIFSIGYSLEGPHHGLDKEPFLRFHFCDITLFLMVLGTIVAWFREDIGASIIFGSFIFYLVGVFITVHSYPNYRIYLAWFFFLFPLIGLLHLFCWRQSRKTS